MYGIGDNFVASDFDPTLDDAEIAELGLAHEIISDELYLPSHPSRDWIRCYVSTTGPGCYRMYLEGKKRVRFLLSAKRFEGKDSTFYISVNEDFPGLEYLPIRGHIARLERQVDKSYLLTLNQCHLCDKMLGHFHCGRGELEREVIAKISHYFKVFRPCNAEYRYFQIHIPYISKFGKRKIWCPRAFRRSNVNLGNDVNVNEAIKRDPKAAIVLKSKPPVWNAELKSLVVKFQGNRVLIPSVKNFMLFASADANSSHQSDEDSEQDDQVSDEFVEDLVFHMDEAQQSHGAAKQKKLTAAGVTEVPKIVSALRWRSDSSIESPLRKASRGKSLSHTGLSPGSSPHFSSSAKTAASASNTGIAMNPTGSTDRYASMFQYSFPGDTPGETPSTNHNTDTTLSVRTNRSRDESDSFTGITINRHLPLSTSLPSSSTGNGLLVKTKSSSLTPPSPSPETSPPPSRTNTISYSDTLPGPAPLPASTPMKDIEKQRQEWRRIRQAYAEKYQQYILGDENEPLFQFGKASPTRFVLDFKYPYSPLQAFGVALSVFADDSIAPSASSPFITQSRKSMR